MQRIVDDLLDLSRYESGSWVPNIVSNDLGGIVSDAFTAVHRSAEAKGLTLAFEAPTDRRVDADPTALRQILGNLVENAVRHTARGSITVRAEPAARWRNDRERERYRIGIPPDHLGRIFERFYRVDTAAISRRRWNRAGPRHRPSPRRGARRVGPRAERGWPGDDDHAVLSAQVCDPRVTGNPV